MSELEKTSLSDGFRIALFAAWTIQQGYSLAILAKLFDGGREVNRLHCVASTFSSVPTEEILHMLYQVLHPPHILAIYGHATLRFLRSVFAERLGLFRILDLRKTAIALHDTLPARATAEAILRAYGVPYCEPEAEPSFDAVESLLWAVIGEADRRSYSWDELLRLAEKTRNQPNFSRCAFDPTILSTLPERPGVYAMYDRCRRLLYVGKSSNLRRRMSEYFYSTLRLSKKVEYIRRNIRDISFRLVGSELEALLLENQLIQTHHPALNIQRTVADGRSRYAEPFLPLILITHSARPQKVDAFMFAQSRHAFQITLDPAAHKPPRCLSYLIGHFVYGRPAPKPSRSLRDWGTIGCEICRRYFGRHRSKLHWKEVNEQMQGAGGWSVLQKMAQSVLSEVEEPAEFRDL